MTATVGNPIDRLMAVNETEHFYPIQLAHAFCITADHTHGIFLSFRHTRRCHLYAVNINLTKELTGNHELLMRKKAHAARLFAVA